MNVPSAAVKWSSPASSAIEFLGKELDVTMTLCGVKSMREIDRRVLADWDSNR